MAMHYVDFHDYEEDKWVANPSNVAKVPMDAKCIFAPYLEMYEPNIRLPCHRIL